VLVVDVREPKAFAEGHIHGAANVPAGEIIARLASLPKDRTLVTYCWDMTCALAPKAALELAQKGFKVQFLVGGIAEWTRKGYPIAKSAP
jgi:rhodanese-related sulfurtransferase